MKNYRKILASLLAAALFTASLTACGSSSTESSTESSDADSTDSSASASDQEYIEETLNLANNESQEWTYDSSADAWVLSIVSAVAYPEIEDEQGVSVCVPGAYVTGIDTDGDGTADVTSADASDAVQGSLVIDYDAEVTSTNGQVYTAATAPVILNTGAAGYSEQENSLASTTYAAEGYINVSCGNRGKQSTVEDEDGNTTYTGDAPSCLVDQKNATRFVKYNILLGNLPGSTDYFVSTGGSGGGAHAAMFAATSDNSDYYPYEAEAGAVGVYVLEDGSYSTTVTIDGTDYEISDGAWGCVAYSAITSLAEADMALAFEYYMDTDYEFNTSFQEQLAEYLSAEYMEYINEQNLSVNEADVGFDLNADGDTEDTIELTIEYDLDAYPDTNGYGGTYLDLYLAEFTSNLQWYLDNLDYADGWTWFDSDGNALSDEEVAAMSTEDKAEAFINGWYSSSSSDSMEGGMGGGKGAAGGITDGELPDGDIDTSELPDGDIDTSELPDGADGTTLGGRGTRGTDSTDDADSTDNTDNTDDADSTDDTDGTDAADSDSTDSSSLPDGGELPDSDLDTSELPDSADGSESADDDSTEAAEVFPLTDEADTSEDASDDDSADSSDSTDESAADSADESTAEITADSTAEGAPAAGDAASDSAEEEVGTPDAGTTQSASSSTDSENYETYEEMLEAYQADIAEIEAGDEYGNNIVSLYNPLEYIGDEDTSDPTWTRIVMGASEGDMSMFTSLNLQIAWLNAGVDAEIEWQWDGGHVPSEIFGESLSLYVDEMYAKYVDGAAEVTKAEAETQTENGTAETADGTDLSSWVDASDLSSVSFSLADAVSYRTAGASKAMPGFDVIDYGQEDYVFGDSDSDARHWNSYLLEILEEYQDVLEPLFNSGE